MVEEYATMLQLSRLIRLLRNKPPAQPVRDEARKACSRVGAGLVVLGDDFDDDDRAIAVLFNGKD